jgi:hypothetical protein
MDMSWYLSCFTIRCLVNRFSYDTYAFLALTGIHLAANISCGAEFSALSSPKCSRKKQTHQHARF